MYRADAVRLGSGGLLGLLSVLTMTPKTLDLNWRKPVTVASHLDSGLQVHFAGMLKHDMYPKRSEGSITHRTGGSQHRDSGA